MGCEWRVIFGAGIIVLEVVDHLFDPHHVGVGHQVRLIQVLADFRIGSGINIDGECGQRSLFGGHEGCFDDLLESIAC